MNKAHHLQDNGLEIEILKIYLSDPMQLDKTTLEPEDFSVPAHGIIFEKMLYLRNICDMLSLKTELEKTNRLKEVGGESFIVSLFVETKSTNSREYCEAKIKDLSERRKAINRLNSEYKYITDLNIDYRAGSESGIFKPIDIKKDVLDYYENGERSRHYTGIKSLDKYFTIAPWEFYIITGIPGHGKSEFIDWLLMNQIQLYGDKVAYFSPENYPLQRHAAKLLEKITHKPFMRGPTERMTTDEIIGGINNLSESVYFIYPDEKELTLDYILEKFKICKAKYNINGVVIDPFNEIEWNCPNGMNQSEYIGQCLTKMRRFARTHNLYFFLVAHPTKLYKNDDGKYDVPNLYTVSGSANFYNKADVGIVIYRDVEKPGMADIHIAKVRFKWMGEVGVVNLRYDKTTGIYFDINADLTERELDDF